MKIGIQSGKSVQSVYNDLSFRTSLTYPNSRQITFTPDDLNRITHITQDAQHIAQYAYAGPYRVTSRSYLNGTSLSVGYDGGRRATNYTHSGSIAGFEYAYDKEDNKKYEKRTHATKGDAFVYDEIYRLTGVKYGVPNTDFDPIKTYADYTAYDSKEEFSLDGVGNRLQVTNGTTVNYTPNNLNQYEQIDGQTLDYDDNGNLIDDGINTYVYDYANRLLRVTRKSDSKVLGEYKYDALGRRYWKKAWNDSVFVETYFYYDGARCIEERDDLDDMIAQYVFGNGIDEVLTMERNSETYYYHENSLGSIYAATNSSGVVVERYSYDAYGNVSFYDGSGTPISQSTIGNRILFTGREYDIEVKLYHYRIRGYSAEMGRFLQRDLAPYDELANLYTYASSNPIFFTDPSGLFVRSLDPVEKRMIEEGKREVKIGLKCSPYYSLFAALADNIDALMESGRIYVDSSLEGSGHRGRAESGHRIYLEPSLFSNPGGNDLTTTVFHEKMHLVVGPYLTNGLSVLELARSMLKGILGKDVFSDMMEAIMPDTAKRGGYYTEVIPLYEWLPMAVESVINTIFTLREEKWITDEEKAHLKALNDRHAAMEKAELREKRRQAANIQQVPQLLPPGYTDHGPYIETPQGEKVYK
ncbi:RHS repeat domain-containing protein [Planctomycetota bacterium]